MDRVAGGMAMYRSGRDSLRSGCRDGLRRRGRRPGRYFPSGLAGWLCWLGGRAAKPSSSWDAGQLTGWETLPGGPIHSKDSPPSQARPAKGSSEYLRAHTQPTACVGPATIQAREKICRKLPKQDKADGFLAQGRGGRVDSGASRRSGRYLRHRHASFITQQYSVHALCFNLRLFRKAANICFAGQPTPWGGIAAYVPVWGCDLPTHSFFPSRTRLQPRRRDYAGTTWPAGGPPVGRAAESVVRVIERYRLDGIEEVARAEKSKYSAYDPHYTAPHLVSRMSAFPRHVVERLREQRGGEDRV